MLMPPHGAGPSPQHGITLVEQLMAMVVIGVLLAVAAPPLARLLRRNQVQVAQTELIAALRHARGAAAMSGKSTVFCPSLDGTHCSGATRWESGWLIGHDPARKGQPEAAPLRSQSAYAGLVVLGDSGRPLVRFRGDGSAGGTTNTLRICRHGQPDEALVVVVSNSGRVRGAKASTEQAALCAAEQ